MKLKSQVDPSKKKKIIIRFKYTIIISYETYDQS